MEKIQKKYKAYKNLKNSYICLTKISYKPTKNISQKIQNISKYFKIFHNTTKNISLKYLRGKNLKILIHVSQKYFINLQKIFHKKFKIFHKKFKIFHKKFKIFRKIFHKNISWKSKKF